MVQGTCGMLPGGKCPYEEEKKKHALLAMSGKRDESKRDPLRGGTCRETVVIDE